MVRFNPKARLDRSRMRDAGRGGGGGGGLGGAGMRLPIPSGVGGGGCGSILLLVVVIGVMLVANQCGANIPVIPGGDSGGDASDGNRYEDCETGEVANEDNDCARVAVENSLTNYWESELGGEFEPIGTLTTFSGSVNTGCGPADSSVGPFYCPTDRSIYLDTTFFDQVLEEQLGGPDGDFVEFYVLAHEYGHHISNLQGNMNRPGFTQQGPNSDGVRLELQADCYAGMWTRGATEGEEISEITQQDIDEAIASAETVGDDYIQKKTQGQVTEETWTHGSSEQRADWFMVGYKSGDLDKCDTWAVDDVDDAPL